MKNVLKRAISVVMLVAMVIGFVPVIEAKAATPAYYSAIGDSITAPANSYVAGIKTYLGKKHGYCEAINLGVGGLTSGDVLNMLTNSKNQYYNQIRMILRLSNYITIDIGSNDYMLAVLDVYAKHLGCSRDDMFLKFDRLYRQTMSSNKAEAQKAVAELTRASEAVHKDIYVNNVLDKTYNTFKANYIKIISEVKKISPNAKIYVGNLYNPFVGAPIIYFGNIDEDKIAEKYITMSNKMIAANSAGCKVVDIYSLFRSDKYLNSDYKTGAMDPHPNDAGQKLIADRFIAAMK